MRIGSRSRRWTAVGRPETKIDKGPKKKTEKTKAKLKFSSDEPADAYQQGSTFECQLKGKDVKKKLKWKVLD